MLADEFWKRLWVKGGEKDSTEIAKQWVPFEKHTGRQAFGFVKEAIFTEKETYVVYKKASNH